VSAQPKYQTPVEFLFNQSHKVMMSMIVRTESSTKEESATAGTHLECGRDVFKISSVTLF